MIHTRSPILTTLLIMRMKAVEPPGGRHGTNNKTHRCPMGPVGSSANEHAIGRCFSQLHDYLDVRRGPFQSLDFERSGLLYGYCRSRAQALPRRWRQSLASDPAARAAQPGYAGVYQPDEKGNTNQSSDFGIWLFHSVGGKAGPTSGQGNRDSVRRRSIAKAPTPRRIFHPSAQAYPQGQEGRKGIRKGQKNLIGLKKNYERRWRCPHQRPSK